MALNQTHDPAETDGDTFNMEPTAKASHKSYRRKYRKSMVKFEETMRDSTSLFRDEQRILDISRRLAEQNDQILQLLSDLNTFPQVPPRLRYDLGEPPSIERSAADRGSVYDSLTAQSALRTARQRLRDGELSSYEYRQLENKVLDSPNSAPAASYKSLLKIPHETANISRDAGTDFVQGSAEEGYLAILHEEQYLQGTDEFLDGKATTPRPYTASAFVGRTSERSVEREREFQLRNPVSVYNWLRKHQPQVFLQDNEPTTEKAPRPAGSRASKRATNMSTVPIKQEQELYDDEGVAIDASNSSKRKRGRDDDPGYRPKGGNSRPSKRKKEDSSASVKRSKKTSMSEF